MEKLLEGVEIGWERGGFIHVSPNKDLESEFKKDSWKCYNKNKSTNL